MDSDESYSLTAVAARVPTLMTTLVTTLVPTTTTSRRNTGLCRIGSLNHHGYASCAGHCIAISSGRSMIGHHIGGLAHIQYRKVTATTHIQWIHCI